MKPVFKTSKGEAYQGDCLEVLRGLPDQFVQCCVTSPPYYRLRDYGQDGQIGLEKTPDEYVAALVNVFYEVRRVLRDDGTVWLILGDSYHGGGSTTTTGQNTRLYEGKSTLQSRHTDGACNRRPKPRNYRGFRHKDLIGIPWRVAFALQADGWYLRQDIIWAKGVSGQKNIKLNVFNAAIEAGVAEDIALKIAENSDPYVGNGMPESVRDRCTKSHEYLFMLTKNKKYYYDAEAVKENSTGQTKGMAASFKRNSSKRGESICPNSPMPTHRPDRKQVCYDGPKRNRRSVWTVNTRPLKEAHFATFPPDLIKPCIKAGSSKGDTVLDPFLGSGTTGLVAQELGRQWIGIDLNTDYCELAKQEIPAGYQTTFSDLG